MDIFEFANLRIYGSTGLQVYSRDSLAAPFRNCAPVGRSRKHQLRTVTAVLMIFRMISRGTAAAEMSCVNPRAQALKRRTFTFGLRIVRFCRTIRTSWEGQEFADQLFRSGTRVGANYRSACRGRSHADFVAKLGFVVEEADETLYWLELLEAAEICRGPELSALIQEATELWAIFNQSQLTAKRNAGRSREYLKRLLP